MSAPDSREIVIIGLGVGGLYASKAALSLNRKCHVTILEKRDFDQFSPCGLPYVVEGLVKDFDALKYEVPAFGTKLTKLLRHEAIGIDKKRRVVRARDSATGEEKEIGYDALILAFGALPVILPIPGAQEFMGRGVHALWNIESGRDLLEAAQASRKGRAVVVGGGAMGLEAAVGLRGRGLDVAVTKRTPHPFPRNLDPAMGTIITDHLEKMGIRVLFGRGIDRINGTDRVESVEIAGETIECDIVVMAVGMRGDLRLADMAGTQTDKGFIVVNDRMETSEADVFAVGDLVRTHSRIDGTPDTMQLATAAFRQGMVAGVNAAGGDTSYPGVLNTFLTVIGGLQVASTGYTQERAKEHGFDAKAVSTVREIRPHYMPDAHPLHLRVVCEAGSGRILGAQAAGREGASWRINLFSLAIQAGMGLHDLLDTELAYNPPVSQMYDPITQIAEVGIKRLGLPPRECGRPPRT
ncbi:MAG: FAD-dependent oxidoreductase [bacterium]